jgi:hypothetical protein
LRSDDKAILKREFGYELGQGRRLHVSAPLPANE